MRVLQYASRSVATVAVLALAAGCDKDSSGPSVPFDPQGTSADVEAIGHSFDAPAMESYAAVSAHISAVVGAEAALAIQAMPARALAGGKANALRYAASLARQYRSSGLRPSLSAAAIPAEYLGTTFIWDTETGTYVASELSGAPTTGVRFLLYAVNPLTGIPVEPLVELGHVDITLNQSTTSATVRAIVVSGGVTYLDYSVRVSSTSSSASIGIIGFATNGTDRVDFDLEAILSGSEASGFNITLDFLLVLPTRGGFRLDIEALTADILSEDPTMTLELRARGEHGDVTIQGSQTNAGGSFNVQVNGDLFAVITMTEVSVTVTGAGGQPLTAEEEAALEAIWLTFAGGFDFFQDLTDPVT